MHKGLAIPALQICLEAFTWTDGEAVTKVSSFCAAVVVLTISTNNAELLQFVSKDLFSAIIQGLALESNAIISADLVALCREIFVYLCDRDPAPRQVGSDASFCFVLAYDVYEQVNFDKRNIFKVINARIFPFCCPRFCSHCRVSNHMIWLLLKKL